MEQHAIERIRRLRAPFITGGEYTELEEHAEVMHDILRGLHGNVKLRLEVISEALGSSMRTLEREFAERYAETIDFVGAAARGSLLNDSSTLNITASASHSSNINVTRRLWWPSLPRGRSAAIFNRECISPTQRMSGYDSTGAAAAEVHTSHSYCDASFKLQDNSQQRHSLELIFRRSRWQE
jgi:hypothetical protein